MSDQRETLPACTECGTIREVDQWTGFCYECVLGLSEELCEGCNDCEPYYEDAELDE